MKIFLAGIIAALAASQALAAPTLVALLLDPEANAARHKAIIEVRLKGASLGDPDRPGAAHLLVRLDKETPIATAQTRISFHDLGPGPHTITVTLVDEGDKPLGAQDAVWLAIASPPAGD